MFQYKNHFGGIQSFNLDMVIGYQDLDGINGEVTLIDKNRITLSNWASRKDKEEFEKLCEFIGEGW
jgi:hypothetical protein